MTEAIATGVTAASVMGLGPAFCLDAARQAEALGYRSFWTAEVNGLEAFSLLAAAGAATTSMDLGTGVLALQLRTPPLLAMAGATLQALHPEREILIGIGISSPVVAGRWHGAGYGDRPLAQVREFIHVLRLCLSGERVDHSGDFYELSAFRLGVRFTGDRRPRIVLGALNERMLRLGGEVADGVLLNYLPSTLVPWSVEQIRSGGTADVYAYVHCGVGDRPDADRPGRNDLFGYATVDSYAAMFRRAGYGDAVAEIRERHAARDRDGALAAVSDAMIDGIDFVGSAAAAQQFFSAYVDAGVSHPVLFPLPWGPDRASVVRATLEAVAPRQVAG